MTHQSPNRPIDPLDPPRPARDSDLEPRAPMESEGTVWGTIFTAAIVAGLTIGAIYYFMNLDARSPSPQSTTVERSAPAPVPNTAPNTTQPRPQ